jgi:hypothetical protein
MKDKDLVDRIAAAVLYEGYLLYPYRPSVKSRRRWTFGGLYPEAWSAAGDGTDPSWLQAEFLVAGNGDARLEVAVRFLHLIERTVEAAGNEEGGGFHAVESLRVGEELFHGWQEATEHEVRVEARALADLAAGVREERFAFPSSLEREVLRSPEGRAAGRIVRTSRALVGAVESRARAAGEGIFQVTVRARNLTTLDDPGAASRDEALLRSLISAHLVLRVRGGEFVSLLDPPEDRRELAAGCSNVGVWPVLVGTGTEKDILLASPIVLYDYPEVAPESPGDLFDATEIDEILTLRIQTLTDEEKRLAAAVDGRARALLERTDSLGPEILQGLHGRMREVRKLREGEPS